VVRAYEEEQEELSFTRVPLQAFLASSSTLSLGSKSRWLCIGSLRLSPHNGALHTEVHYVSMLQTCCSTAVIRSMQVGHRDFEPNEESGWGSYELQWETLVKLSFFLLFFISSYHSVFQPVSRKIQLKLVKRWMHRWKSSAKRIPSQINDNTATLKEVPSPHQGSRPQTSSPIISATHRSCCT